ncbi:MAG: hypothetical protein ACYTEQ_25415, partial [Planctomycetota bacterium]
MTKTKIMQEQWDYLIILDACRYDYFERVRQDYLPGKLEKIISIGSSTKEWRNKSFTEYYSDVVYVSANPYINSLAPVKGFSAKQHFHKVYDLWLADWDKDKGTVLPETVTKRAIEITRANSSRRAIIHYIQPHEPYLGPSVAGPGFPSPVAGGFLEGVDQAVQKRPLANKVLKFVTGVCYWLRIRGNSFTWKLRDFL